MPTTMWAQGPAEGRAPCRTHAGRGAGNMLQKRRPTLLAAEIRLQEPQGAKWARQVIERAEAIVKTETKDWRAQKAARARWDGVANGKAAR